MIWRDRGEIADRHLVESEAPFPPCRSWIATACGPEVGRRSIRVAAVVGTLLVAINYSDRALAGTLGPTDWAKMVFTYFVPYGVATYAAVQAIRRVT